MKNHRKIIIPLAAAVLLSSCGLDADGRYERAQQSFAENNFTEARLDLLAALKERPEDEGMLLLLGKTQLALGDGEGAAGSFARISKITTPDLQALRGEAELLRGQVEKAFATVDGLETAAAWRVRGIAHATQQELPEAVAAFEQGTEAEGDKAPVFASFARFALGLGDYPKAEELAAKALEHDDGLLDAMLVSGQIHAAQNRLPEALAAYEGALKRFPDNLAATIGRIGILGDQDRLDEADTLLAEVAERHPADQQVLYLQARMATEREDWARVRSLLQSHETAMRSHAATQVLYAQALLRLGQVQQARSWLEPLVNRYPNQRLARRLLGEAQLQGGDARSALDRVRVLADRPDASPEELKLAAKAAKQAGDEKAAEYARRASMPAPEWMGGELARADTALRNRQWQSAADSYRRILERSAQPNAMVLNNYAYALSQLGDDQAALRFALQALELSPEHPSIMDTAGWLLVETGTDRPRGVALLRRAAANAPDNPAIARHLAQATS